MQEFWHDGLSARDSSRVPLPLWQLQKLKWHVRGSWERVVYTKAKSAKMDQAIASALAGSLDPTNAAAAGAGLKQMESSPEFSTALLRLTSAPAADMSVRQAAATYFKNLVRRSWVCIACLPEPSL